jgi:hypothetical protein
MAGKHFAAIPTEVLTSDAFKTLPNSAVRVLVAIAAQFRGNNNGDLAMTWSTALLYGISSKNSLVESLPELQRRGFIQKTKQGGKRPLGPTLYAITWQPINDLKGKIESGATTTASNDWADWKEPTSAPKRPRGINIARTAGGPDAKNRQDHGWTDTGPSVDQRSAVTGPLADQRTPFNGTTDGPPSRSWREGQTVSAAPSVQSNSVLRRESVAEGATPKVCADEAARRSGPRTNRPEPSVRAPRVTSDGPATRHPKASAPDSEAEQLRKATKFLQSQPDASSADVARILSVPLSIVVEARLNDGGDNHGYEKGSCTAASGHAQ